VLGGDPGDFQDILNLAGRAVEDEGVAALRVSLGQVDQVFEAGGLAGLRGRAPLLSKRLLPARDRLGQDSVS
jgi:hypothetical protein